MRISVLIPTFNRAAQIARAVGSAQAGDWDDLEIIISDNGSTDGSQAVIQGLAAQDHRITVLLHQDNRGPLANWRACLDRASGGLVHWLWSDDWIEPGAYRFLRTAMDASGAKAALCAARVVVEGLPPILPAERPEGVIAHVLGDQVWTGRDLVHRLLTMRMPLVSPAAALLPLAACRRVLARSIPEFADLRCEQRAIGPDSLMILEALLEAPLVVTTAKPLACFSAGPDSISVGAAGQRLATHYAWARLGWARERGLPRWWSRLDVLRLLRANMLRAAWRGGGP